MNNFLEVDYWADGDGNETNDYEEMRAWLIDEGREVYGVCSQLLITDRNGIYIPKIFYDNFDFEVWGLDKEDYEDLADPESESYWDSWNDLCSSSEKQDEEGRGVFRLEMEGDLFARMYIEGEVELITKESDEEFLKSA